MRVAAFIEVLVVGNGGVLKKRVVAARFVAVGIGHYWYG